MNDFGFFNVAACSLPVVLGDTDKNADEIIKCIDLASKHKVQLLVFPELCITGYTCGDLFLRKDFINHAERSLKRIVEYAKGTMVICVGMPVEDHGKLFNCAVYIQNGKIIGVVPKTYIPNYNEFYEKRWFVSSSCRTSDSVMLADSIVPFSENLLIRGSNDVVIGTEICEDLWIDSPPSGLLSRAGATIIVNPSASNDLVGKYDYRKNLVKMQSGRCRCVYIYASAGLGESSTDLVFSGHCMIVEDGVIIREGRDSLIIDVVDIEKCVNDRRKYNSDVWEDSPDVCEVSVPTEVCSVLPTLVSPYPFVPSGDNARSNRCDEIVSLQARGLVQRLRATGFTHAVIGVSGGLDSTLALLVTCKAFDMLGYSRKNIYAVTMPGFGTSNETLELSNQLMNLTKVDEHLIDIRHACEVHLSDIGHPFDVYDVIYENVQARERTQVLFDVANMVSGLVIGTGDLSELALGWCTYNADHMSNYAINIGVPKTLVKYLVKSLADKESNSMLRHLLYKICDLPISPELLPLNSDGTMQQKTEESIGKYDLHDFFLYHFIRNGFGYDKIFTLACIAFKKLDKSEIKKTLDIFYSRFRTQQFKRSCIPDGVKIGSVSLSPRGDWRMPSDLAMLF